MVNNGIAVKPIDINKSGYFFEPDEENNAILYGFKALNGVGGEVISTIIANRPYNSFQDFLDKNNESKTVVLSLIKGGAFDCFDDRVEIMRQYISITSQPKKKVSMQNFRALADYKLIPQELKLQRMTYNFDKSMKKECKYTVEDFALDKSEKHYTFFCKYFDADALNLKDNHLCLSKRSWKKIYDETMKAAKNYIQENNQVLLDKLNAAMFQEEWNKYAAGSISAWEMDSLGYYYHKHELINVDYDLYNIKKYADLPSEPVAAYTFKKDDKEIKIPATCRIIGAVVGKNNTKAQVDILTRDSGVVTVKFNLEYFAKYNRRINAMVKGENKVVEQGWFQKGTLIAVNGYRRGNIFKSKADKKTNSHQLYKITKVNQNGTIEMTNTRFGD